MKEDLIKRLVDSFKQEAEKYSNELNGVVNFNCEDFFKKNNPEKGYHSVDASIIFKEFTLKLEYKVNVSMLIPKSTVEIRFMFENGKLPVEYSIYDLFNIIDKNNFNCYTFPYVTSESKMKEVLKYLVDTFSKYRDKIEELAIDKQKIEKLEQDIKDKIDVLLNEKVFESRDAFYLMHMLELYYTIDISRFTTECYLDYTSGKYKKAIKKYSKLGNKITIYEQRLVEHMKSSDIITPMEAELNTFNEARKLKNAKMELLPMFISWLVLTPFWCIVYDILFYIALYFLSKEAIYIGGADAFMLFMPAFTTAIINSFFIRKIVYKIFFKKNYNKIIALDEIENSGKVTNMMLKLFQFTIAMGIVFSILIANTNIAFYEDNFKNNLDFLNIEGETISYQDVESVYKTNKIKNNFGQIVNKSTYVIVLKDERKINLYYHMQLEDIEENIIPIFKNHNIEIREIELENNITKQLRQQTK